MENNKRIIAVANLLVKQSKIIDIGCDHAYLSIYLLKNNLVDFVYNVDINQEPLNQGIKNTIKILGNLTNSKFIKNNGLQDLQIQADAISIMGMGAPNIIQIISNVKIQPKFYVVQANNDRYKIRTYINQCHGKILAEQIVFENNKYYEIIKFSLFSNDFIPLTEKEIFLGKYLPNDKLVLQYFQNRYNFLKKICVNSQVNPIIKKEYDFLKEYIELWQEKN